MDKRRPTRNKPAMEIEIRRINDHTPRGNGQAYAVLASSFRLIRGEIQRFPKIRSSKLGPVIGWIGP